MKLDYQALNSLTFSDKDKEQTSWASVAGINTVMNASRVSDSTMPLSYDYYSPINDSLLTNDGAFYFAELVFGYKLTEANSSNSSIVKAVYDIKKPIVAITNTISAFAAVSTDTTAQGGSHWVTMVILPKNYQPPHGTPINNNHEKIYFIDSINSGNQFPLQVKNLLCQRQTRNCQNGSTHDIDPTLANAEFIKISTGQQKGGSDCGWWAVYNSLMLVYTGNLDFLDRFRMFVTGVSAFPLRRLISCLETDTQTTQKSYMVPLKKFSLYGSHHMQTTHNQLYAKDTLLPAGLAGSCYQVKILMLYAFEAFCNPEKKFTLLTEPKGFAKFDDLILWLPDRIQVLQAKHSYDPNGVYTLKNLLEEETEDQKKKDSKKAVLSLYLDAWLQIEAKNQVENPEKASLKPIEYIFYTNHGLSQADNLHELYDPQTQRFSSFFILGGVALTEAAKDTREKILTSLYIYLKNLQDSIKNACEEFANLFNNSVKIDIKTDDISDSVKKLLIALKNNECLEEVGEGRYKRNIYKFSSKFINDTVSSSVLKKLRAILNNNLSNLTLETAESNFNKSEFEKSPSALSTALYTGLVGDDSIDLFTFDFDHTNKSFREKPLEGILKNFFEQFIYKVQQPNESELTEILKDKIGREFKNNDVSYYLYFYDRMLDFLKEREGQAITEEDMQKLFAKAKLAFDRNKLIGYGKRYEYRLSQECDIKIKGRSYHNLVQNSLQKSESISVYYADQDLTVAMSVYEDLLELTGSNSGNNLKETDYGFIDASYAVLDKDHNCFDDEHFKLMIIDHAQHLEDEKLKNLVEAAVNTQKS